MIGANASLYARSLTRLPRNQRNFLWHEANPAVAPRNVVAKRPVDLDRHACIYAVSYNQEGSRRSTASRSGRRTSHRSALMRRSMRQKYGGMAERSTRWKPKRA